MITKDNILEVLKHNMIDFTKRRIFQNGKYVDVINLKGISIIFDNPNLIPMIEAYYGKKLKPLPESNPFSEVSFGQWVKCIKNELNMKYLTIGKWYQRLDQFDYKNFVYIGNDNNYWKSSNSKEWDLTDIRDYNPDEEIWLKVDLLDSRKVRLFDTGDNNYELTIESLFFNNLTRQDLFTISLLIQKVLSGIEE